MSMLCPALRIRKALDTNSTASAFTAKIPTATEPTNSGVFRLSDSQHGLGTDGVGPDMVQLIPFGGNDNNDVFNMRLWGWSRTAGAPGASGLLWVPQLLAELAVTLGSISATAIAANMLMADTIVVTYGDAAADGYGVMPISPANDLSASALVHLRGSEYIEFDFDLHTNCDAMNCLWRGV